MPGPPKCPLCGIARSKRGNCFDIEGCLLRQQLWLKGRPRESDCECANWPCPCVCHQTPHKPQTFST